MLKFIGWVTVIFNIGAAILSTSYLLTNLKMNFLDVLVVNAAIVSVAVLALGFIINNNLLMAVSVPFLALYGTFGILQSSWIEGVPAEQVGNLVMTAGIIYIMYVTIKKRSYVEFISGIVIGMFLLLTFYQFQADYLKERPGIAEKLGPAAQEKTPLTEHPTIETGVPLTSPQM